MRKKLLYILLGAAMMVGGIALAAPISQNFTNIQPFTTDLYSNGTSTNEWYQLFTKYASTTGALSAPTICFTGDICRTTWPSSSASFPFTPTTNFNGQQTNATTTALWFQAGPYSLFASSTAVFSAFNSIFGTTTYASSTALTANNLFSTNATTTSLGWTGITDNILYTSHFGQTVGTATSSVTCSSGVSCGSTSYVLGGALSITNSGVTSMAQTYGTSQTGAITFATSTTAINNDWGITNSSGAFTFNIPTANISTRGLLSSTDWNTFNNKASFAWPFTPTTNFATLVNATGTPVWFQAGLTSSSTVVLGSSAGAPFFWGNSGLFSISSTSPWAQFAINPIAGTGANQFVIGSSTATSFIVTNAGRIGIGNTSPNGPLDIQIPASTINSSILSVGNVSNQQSGILGNAGTNGIDFAITANLRNLLLDTNTGAVGISSSTPWASFAINPKAGSASNQFVVGSSTATSFVINNARAVGIGTTTPNIPNGLLASSTIQSYEFQQATSTSMTIDFSSSNSVIVQQGTSAITFTFSNYADHPGKNVQVRLCNPHGGTPGVPIWPNGSVLIWAADTAPTQTTGVDKCDDYSFTTTIATSTTKTAIVFGAQTAGF